MHLLGFTVFAFVVSIVYSFFLKMTMAQAVGCIAGSTLGVGVLLFGYNYVFLPVITHWFGFPIQMYICISMLIPMFLAFLIKGWCSTKPDKVLDQFIIMGIIFVVVYCIIIGIIHAAIIPPRFTNEQEHRDLAGLLNPIESDEALQAQEVDPERKVQVSPEMALLRARNAMPPNVGSYLEVADNPALQVINGYPYYIVGLRLQPRQWAAFDNNGRVIPGYFKIDALNRDTPAEYVGDYPMRIIDSERFFFGYELDRYAHNNFLSYSGYRFEDLHSLEVDEEGNPYYTATLLRHKVGKRGDVVVGSMVLDPVTGQITEYDVDNIPDWQENVWTKNIVKEYATNWGRYNEGAVWHPFNNAGKRKVDAITDVFTSDGTLWYQVTMTSLGHDTTLTDIIYVNPKNGEAFRYDVAGKGLPTIGHVNDLIEQASQRINPKGFDVVEVELDWINGEWVYYGILLGKDDSGETTGAFNGYALFRASDAAEGEIDAVVITSNLSEAIRQLQTNTPSEQVELSQDSETKQFRGVVERVYSVEGEPASATTIRLMITPSVTTTERVPLQMGALEQDAVAMHLIPGDEIIVTAQKGTEDKWWTVTKMRIVGDPVFDE